MTLHTKFEEMSQYTKPHRKDAIAIGNHIIYSQVGVI